MAISPPSPKRQRREVKQTDGAVEASEKPATREEAIAAAQKLLHTSSTPLEVEHENGKTQILNLGTFTRNPELKIESANNLPPGWSVSKEMRQVGKLVGIKKEVVLYVSPDKNRTCRSLGQVQRLLQRPYHGKHYLLPLNFSSTTRQQSFMNPGEIVEYRQNIVDGGNKALFQLIASDAPENKILSDSPANCWKSVSDRINQRRMELGMGFVHVEFDGVSLFGHEHPNVVKLLEGVDGIENCKTYVHRALRGLKKRKAN